MLSDEQASALVKYYRTVQLTDEQKGRLALAYWEASPAERTEIARAYSNLFANDGTFVQKLIACHDLINSNNSSSAGGSGPEGGGGGPVGSATAAAGSPTAASPTARLSHAQVLLRTQIRDQFPKLAGPGPFVFRFGIVQSEEERAEVIALYHSQFLSPDLVSLQQIVCLPQSASTRTRRQLTGACTWYLRCLTTGDEVACAVTVTAHRYPTLRFVEMPLFATAAGYKRSGLARVLNAALVEWCAKEGVEFIMISADREAVPFWTHLGYRVMERRERTKVAFYYENECYDFEGVELLIGYCGSHRRGGMPDRVGEVMRKLPKYQLTGQHFLPFPL